MTKPFDPNKDRDDSDEFIEDLESIKGLLDQEEQTPVDAEDEDGVPLLDDQIDNVVSEHMGDDTFQTLLSDTWRDSVEEMFEQARSSIEANSTAWLPEHTDELAEALKVRIDASVRAWLAETLEANIGRLRERIVSELSTEILNHMRAKIGSQSGTASGQENKH